MKIHIAVMDYCKGCIKMYSPDVADVKTIDVEGWLYHNTDYKSSTCDYMYSSKEIDVVYPLS